MTDKELLKQAYDALDKITDMFDAVNGRCVMGGDDIYDFAIQAMMQLDERLKQEQPKTNQSAETCERAKLWGWAILHSDGTEAYVRPRVKEFFGTISETEPFTAEDLRKADREWCGLAPHTMVTLYTPPQPEKTNQCAETCERAKLCAVCGVSLNQKQDAVAWVYTNAQGKTVIVESDVQPYDDAVPLFKSEPQPEQEKTK